MAKVVGVAGAPVGCVWFAAGTLAELTRLAELTELAELVELATALIT